MINPVEFINRKLAMVEKVVKEAPEKVARERQYATVAYEPLYEYDDDHHHPLTGDPLTIILLAEATRTLLEMHKTDGAGRCQVCNWGAGRGPTPCLTVRELATGWGWKETR